MLREFNFSETKINQDKSMSKVCEKCRWANCFMCQIYISCKPFSVSCKACIVSGKECNVSYKPYNVSCEPLSEHVVGVQQACSVVVCFRVCTYYI